MIGFRFDRILISGLIRFTVCLLSFIVALLVSLPSFAQQQVNEDLSRDGFIFTGGVGTSWRTGRSNSSGREEQAYFNDLKRGTVIRFKGLLPLDDQSSAVGLMFSNFSSREAELRGDTEQHNISFIGAAFQQYDTFGPDDNNMYILDYALGYMSYNSEINGQQAFTGGNIGLSMAAGYRLLVSPNLGLGFDLNVEGTTVGKWETPNGRILELQERDNLFRIDLSFVIDIRL